MIVSIAATVAVAAAALAIVGTSLAGRAEEEPPPARPQLTLRWAEGSCASRTGSRFDLVPCDAGVATVIAIADPCPAPTDLVVDIGQGRTACLRNHRAPHPGDPGMGGGVVRAGDCVTSDGRERPCTTKGWYGRAVAVVPERCPAGTRDALELSGTVVCLGEGGAVPSVGDCVGRPRDDRVTRVPCGSRQAWARVTAFAERASACPDGSNRYLTSTHRPLTCLRVNF